MFSKFLLYFHTLRFLKPIQIYGRIFFYLFRPSISKSVIIKLRSVTQRWTPSSRKEISMIDSETFLFLNKEGELSKIGWNGSEREKLWRYNQHYFDDLNSIHSEDRTIWHSEIIQRWIHDNPIPHGIGWDPYPTSLRIVNWIKWNLSGNQMPEDSYKNLFIQARWLAKRIEWHLLGNHLFSNAKALIFAGLFFDDNESKKWLKRGLSIVNDELSEQVLEDGGNIERSTMYHSIFLEDLLDLINIAQVYPESIDKNYIKAWEEQAKKMLNWLELMCHPDGQISFFNDCAIGIAPSPNELYDYSSRLNILLEKELESNGKISTHELSNSGYIRVKGNDYDAIIDVAPIGADYLPGHGHADTLSFELSLFGSRFFVNGGTSHYEIGDQRLIERSTSSHNTLEINHENSSEVWSSFRVARRAMPFNLKVSSAGDSVMICCSHDGYTRLKGSPIHERIWRFNFRNIVIEDHIKGDFNSAITRYHLHPNLELSQRDEYNWTACLSDNEQKIYIKILDGQANLGSSVYCPEFGKNIQSSCIEITPAGRSIITEVSW